MAQEMLMCVTQGGMGRGGEVRIDLRVQMRRCNSALTPVLLRPFTWQMDDSWRLYRELLCTCRWSDAISCRETVAIGATADDDEAAMLKCPG
jgi:hypothetical protein